MSAPIAVTVLGGYLGAGKTTLVNHLLRAAPFPFAVLVNDFGAVEIDRELIVATDGETMSLANGCICCSIADGFAAALATIRARPTPPTRLLIETSGVADPAPVAAYALTPGFELDAVIVMADAQTVTSRAADPYVGDTIRRQLRQADLVVLNKIDLCADLMQVVDWSGRAAPAARVITAQSGVVPPELVFGLGLPRRSRVVAATLGGEDHAYATWSTAVEAPLDRARFAEFLAELPAGLLRLKGIVRFADRPDERVVVQCVGSRRTLVVEGDWNGGPSRLVAIGAPGSAAPTWPS